VHSEALRRRRVLALGVSVALPAVLVYGLGHRGVHAARNLLVPGAGLIDEHRLVGVAFMVAAVVATIAWVRWGADWVLGLTIVVSTVVSYAWTTNVDTHRAVAGALHRLQAAHEFPLVVLVVGAISWLRTALGRLPGMGRLARRRSARARGLADVPALRPVDRCRAVAVLALSDAGKGADVEAAIRSLDAADIALRARRVGFAARGRTGGDPFRVDHAPARAARSLAGRLSDEETQRFVADATRSAVGVPASEPGWVRTVDATLAAIALERAGSADAGRRWAEMLHGPLSLRRGHRPGWWWTPLGVTVGSAAPWEHAVSTALARSMGWIGDADWSHLRALALGASARGTDRPHDERLIAAARIWLVFVDDPTAARLLARPTICHDPLAVALDRHAAHLVARFAVQPRPTTPVLEGTTTP